LTNGCVTGGILPLEVHFQSTPFEHLLSGCSTACFEVHLSPLGRMTTHLENLEKSGNWIVVREKSGKMEKVRESYNHHLAAAREKDITAFLRYQSRHSSM